MSRKHHEIGTRSVVALALATLVLLGACSSSEGTEAGDDVAQARATARSAASSKKGGKDRPLPEQTVTPVTPAPPAEGVGDALPTPAANDAAGSGKAPPGPPPPQFPYKTSLKVRSSLTPACVSRGGRIELEVSTEPSAAVAYNALYSDGYGGGAAPYGRGYGGNDKGFADKDSGTYVSAWVVSPDAPIGRARVDVIIGFQGKWGYDTPHFAVADADGNCPSGWLKDSDREGK